MKSLMDHERHLLDDDADDFKWELGDMMK